MHYREEQDRYGSSPRTGKGRVILLEEVWCLIEGQECLILRGVLSSVGVGGADSGLSTHGAVPTHPARGQPLPCPALLMLEEAGLEQNGTSHWREKPHVFLTSHQRQTKVLRRAPAVLAHSARTKAIPILCVGHEVLTSPPGPAAHFPGQ